MVIMDNEPTTGQILEVLLDFRDAAGMRFDAIDRKLLEHDRRFDEHDRRFDVVEGGLDGIDRRLGRLETRIEDVERKQSA